MDIGECPKPRSLVAMVLGFMGEPLLGPRFACEVDAYLSITGTPGERLGLAAVGEAAFVRRLRADAVPGLVAGRRGHGCDGASAAPRYVDTRQAAAMVGLSPRTMECYRTTGQGPAFSRLGAGAVRGQRYRAVGARTAPLLHGRQRTGRAEAYGNDMWIGNRTVASRPAGAAVR